MDDGKKCLLFYSWQSDRKECRNFVTSIMDKIPEKFSNLVTARVERDTVNVPGSPDIGDTIFERIDNCDLFIADITLINDKGSGYRRTPNPNVMIELGYAIKALGWERILLLRCIDYGDIEELPFDINHRRICNYTLALSEDDAEIKTEKKKQSKQAVFSNIEASIILLLEKNQLFGGMKRKNPKFEITWQGNNGCMMNLVFKMKNVSSLMISNLQSQGLTVMFADGNKKVLKCASSIHPTALAMGEQAEVHLNNPLLGVDLRAQGLSSFDPYNAWGNIDVQWQFSCEDEEGNKFWYEMKQHIDDANKTPRGIWPTRYIG